MIPIVERFLLYLINRAKRRHPRPIDRVSRFLLDRSTGASLDWSSLDWPGLDWPGLDWPGLDWLSDQACLSQRQFYRQFIEREGISPKLYARIAHFENAIQRKNAQPNLDWLSVALQLSYYDYQHLARDSREFTHLSPTAFMLKEAGAPERVSGQPKPVYIHNRLHNKLAVTDWAHSS
ncbi:hypothetical protein GCM10027341_09750 [Spirosoma knui]